MSFAQLNILEYLTLPAARKTGLSDHSLKYLLSGKASIYGLKENGVIISYALVSKSDKVYSLLFIETIETLRHKGYGTQLLKSILDAVNSSIFVNISNNLPYSSILLQLMEKVGYSSHSTSKIFSVDCDAHNKAIFFNEGKGISNLERATNRLLRGGKQCLPLCELSQEQLEVFRKAENHELNPVTFLDNPEKNMDEQLSYVVFDQDELAAYTLLTRTNTDQVVIEQFSTLLSRLHSGIIIAPFFYSISAVIRLYYPTVTKVSFTVYDDNKDGLSTFTHFIKELNYTIQRNDIFNLDRD